MSQPWIAVSACLLGEEVRYDGRAKPSEAVQRLAERFEVGMVCPEVEAGLGIPRPPVKLVAGKRLPRAVGVEDPSLDVSEELQDHAIAWLLNHEGIDGMILKARSPSCGLGTTPVFDGEGGSTLGSGLFARILLRQRPWLPAVDEEGVADLDAADHFAQRVRAAFRLRTELAPDFTPDRLVAFHTRHKLQLMAHAPGRYNELGHLVAQGTTFQDYRRLFMTLLAIPPQHGRNLNALEHAFGYFKQASEEVRAPLREAIDRYGEGAVSLDEPRALLLSAAEAQGIEWLVQQSWFLPQA